MTNIEVGQTYQFKLDPRLKVKVLNQINIDEWSVMDLYLNIMYRMGPENFIDFELDKT